MTKSCCVREWWQGGVAAQMMAHAEGADGKSMMWQAFTVWFQQAFSQDGQPNIERAHEVAQEDNALEQVKEAMKRFDFPENEPMAWSEVLSMLVQSAAFTVSGSTSVGWSFVTVCVAGFDTAG